MYVDIDGMEPEDAAALWLADNCARWTGWASADQSICPEAPTVAPAATIAAPALDVRGISDTEVKIGSTAAVTGPVAVIGSGVMMGATAYYDKVNSEGGVLMSDGVTRMIDYTSYDDGFEAARTLEGTRRLCEEDGVFAIVSPVGTPVAGTETYVNQQQCPQVLVHGGMTSIFSEVNRFQTGFWPTIVAEGELYGRHIVENNPDAKLALLLLDAPPGDDFEIGIRAGIEGSDVEIVEIQRAAPTDASLEGHVAAMQASGADTLLMITVGGQAPQAIQLTGTTGWRPQIYLLAAIAQVPILEPAGFDNAEGLISSSWLKDPTDTADPGIAEYIADIEEFGGDANPLGYYVMVGWTSAALFVKQLKALDPISVDSLLDMQYELTDFRVPTLLDGISLNTSPGDPIPVQAFVLRQFIDGEFVPLGGVVEVSN